MSTAPAEGMPVRVPRRHQVVHHTVDGALRYHRVLDELEAQWRPDTRVLEVGSGAGGVAVYLDHPVVGVDSTFDRTAPLTRPNLQPVTGTAADLPLGDGEFDVVLCLEMLEHIPGADRHAVLSELLRVLRPGGRLVLTFPTDEPARMLDTWLNVNFQRRFGTPHPWVIEHLEEGVPDAQEVARELEGLGATVHVGHHLSLHAFVIVQGLYSLQWGGRVLGRLLRSRPAARIVYRALRSDDATPAYRAVLTVDKPAAT